jgi:single-stranded-DNA-specific exonuclease
MSAPFLGVAVSATGRRWSGPPAEQDLAALALAQATGLPDPVCRVLAARGVAAGEARAFLAPTLRDLMPDPSVLRDMDRAAARLAAAVRAGERIAVFADYDVDGAASAALLLRWLAACGTAATLYVPDRIGEGYGPNVPAMQALGRDHRLIVCVDCGTLAREPVAAARGAGAEVIVADHHLAAGSLPEALVVNPNRKDEAGGLGHLCAAGVVFLLLVAANRQRRAAGEPAPDLMGLLDLVALATVADVAPLAGLNRAFVRQGLRVLGAGARPGLAALAAAARMTGAPAAHHLGYVFGPRINAGGRVGRADLGARLLATDDPATAQRIAAELEALNRARQEIEARITEAALAQAEARGGDGPLVWAAGADWHPGVVGIVAARLKEAFDRPAIVFGMAEGEARGSGRSAQGVDLGRAVQRLADEGLILRGGGHRMAAGLSVAPDGIGAAMERLAALLAAAGAGPAAAGNLVLDGAIAAAAATPELVEALEAAGPYGAGAPAPRFALPTMRIAHLRIVGEQHLLLTLADLSGTRVEGAAFRSRGRPLGRFLEAAQGRPLHVAGRLESDDWNGRRRVRLRIEDAAPAD